MPIYYNQRLSLHESVERRVLDLETGAVRGPGSIPTGGNILRSIFT